MGQFCFSQIVSSSEYTAIDIHFVTRFPVYLVGRVQRNRFFLIYPSRFSENRFLKIYFISLAVAPPLKTLFVGTKHYVCRVFDLNCRAAVAFDRSPLPGRGGGRLGDNTATTRLPYRTITAIAVERMQLAFSAIHRRGNRRRKSVWLLRRFLHTAFHHGRGSLTRTRPQTRGGLQFRFCSVPRCAHVCTRINNNNDNVKYLWLRRRTNCLPRRAGWRGVGVGGGGAVPTGRSLFMRPYQVNSNCTSETRGGWTVSFYDRNTRCLLNL